MWSENRRALNFKALYICNENALKGNFTKKCMTGMITNDDFRLLADIRALLGQIIDRLCGEVAKVPVSKWHMFHVEILFVLHDRPCVKISDKIQQYLSHSIRKFKRCRIETCSHYHSLGYIIWTFSKHLRGEVRWLKHMRYAAAHLYEYDHRSFRNANNNAFRKRNIAISKSMALLNERKKKKAARRLIYKANTEAEFWNRGAS